MKNLVIIILFALIAFLVLTSESNPLSKAKCFILEKTDSASFSEKIECKAKKIKEKVLDNI